MMLVGAMGYVRSALTMFINSLKYETVNLVADPRRLWTKSLTPRAEMLPACLPQIWSIYYLGQTIVHE